MELDAQGHSGDRIARISVEDRGMRNSAPATDRMNPKSWISFF